MLFVNQQLQTVAIFIESHQKDLQSETKSSAGDKHETGRAMLQLEMEKAGKQLASILQMKETLRKIPLNKTSKKAHLGSLIYTDKNNYFLSISMGKITINKTDYYAISTQSPIGKLLLGKEEGAVIFWNDESIKITQIL